MSYLFSRKKKDIGSVLVRGHIVKFRVPKLLEMNSMKQDAKGFLTALEDYGKAREAHEKKYDVPKALHPKEVTDEEWEAYLEERQAILEEHPFSYDLRFNNQDLEALMLFFQGIITEIDGLEDEDGPFEWSSLSPEEQRECLHSLISDPIMAASFYHQIQFTLIEINSATVKRQTKKFEQENDDDNDPTTNTESK